MLLITNFMLENYFVCLKYFLENFSFLKHFGKPLHFFHYNHSNNLALKRIPIYYLIPY